MFIDEVQITVKAGNGGDGCVSFRREKYVPKGGPDGGKGGDGGDLLVEAVTDLAALRYFRHRKHFEAENGQRGLQKNKSGEAGKDLVLRVPMGTVVTDTATGETFELVGAGDRWLMANGGKGGQGNTHFKSSTNTTPRQFERGGLGQKRTLKLELQLLADVGLIGLPNAGKSSLLNALTRAKAPVANYPFTTLEPNLGVADGRVLADIPGLIEGAARGKGLGHAFLRHVRRTKLLVHCLSVEADDLERDYRIVRGELEAFDKRLVEKQELVVLTKVDLVSPKEVEAKLAILKKLAKDPVLSSIEKPELLKALMKRLMTEVSKLSQ